MNKPSEAAMELATEILDDYSTGYVEVARLIDGYAAARAAEAVAAERARIVAEVESAIAEVRVKAADMPTAQGFMEGYLRVVNAIVKGGDA